MSRNECALVVLDPTAQKQPALERAALIGQALGLPLELFVAQYDQYVAGDEKARESLLEHTRERVQTFTNDVAAPVRSIDVRWDRPIDEAVIEKARECNSALVVKDTHYHSVLKRTIFSNTDWNLIRDCPAPLLLVKDKAVADKPRIMATVDPFCSHDKPAELDHRILALGRELTAGLGGELTAVHVFDAALAAAPAAVAAPGMGVAPALPPSDIEALEDSHRASLHSLLEEAGLDSSQGVLRRGTPADELIRCADELNADLVITGAIARSGLDRIFIGATAERILDRLPCDLLVVKLEAESPRR